MPRLLLVAATTGYQTRVFAEAAARLGFDLALATDRCHVMDDPWGDRALPVRFDEPGEAEAAIAAAGPFDGVLAVGDRPAQIAARAAQRLGLPFHPPAAADAARDKHLARGLYRAAGMRVPEYFRVALAEGPSEAARRAPYPCVLKPLGLSASRGVIRADNEGEFAAAFRRIEKMLTGADVLLMREEQNRYIQVESFIPGREFAVEGLMTQGRFQVLALFDKPDPLDGPFFEETLYVTPSREPAGVQRALREAADAGARALGLRHGPVHAELRYNDQGCWVLEMAARPIGGLCSGALRFGGAPLEEILLRHAAGEDFAALRIDGGASGVMMIPVPKEGIYESAEGVAEAESISGVERVVITAKQGQKLTPWPEGSSYLGFVFARAEAPAGVERALRRAHEKLHFQIATILPVAR